MRGEKGPRAAEARCELDRASFAVQRQVRSGEGVHPETEEWFARALREYAEACVVLPKRKNELHPQDYAMRRLALVARQMRREAYRAPHGFAVVNGDRRAAGADDRAQTVKRRLY